MDALLRDGLLTGTRIAVSGDGELAAGVRDACGALGAAIGDDAPVVLVCEADMASVHAALDGTWDVIHGSVSAGLLDRRGKVVLLAPRPGDAHRAAARAGLENLARTLGIEWARFGVRTVTVLPGASTTAAEVGQLVAYLASQAGDYFSGCAITLGSVE